jgi:GPH family glycoside/pentoside/hexuronide:cation symporter
MPFFALTPELTSDYDERTSLMSARAFFSIVGSLLAYPIPPMIIGGFSPDHTSNVLRMGIIFAIVSAIPLYIVFFGTRERPEYIVQKQPGLLESIRSSLKNRPFIFGAGIYLFTWFTVDLLMFILIYFIKHVVNRESSTDLITGVIFIIAIIALPLWTWTSRRLNKRLAYILGMAFLAAVLMALITLNAATPLYFILILCVLAGIGVSAAHVIPWSMIPDAIEYGELKTGERHEGMFYSLISLSQKIASSFAIPLGLLVLGKSGYMPNSVEQPASAILGIRIVTGPIPAVMICFGILFAILYPLGREGYTQITRELEARRSAAPREGK